MSEAIRIAYLTTAYPHVSHTFIKREILELERRGLTIERLAIRPGETLVDVEDIAENSRTLHLLAQPKTWIVAQALRGVVLAGHRILSAARATWRFHRASDRGLLRHLAYLLEAAVLLPTLLKRDIPHLHVHFGTNAATVAYLARLMGGPQYSLTVHGPDEFDAPKAFSLATKVQHAEFTIAISSFCASQIKRWVPYDHWNRIHVIGCTVGDEWFRASRPISAEDTSIVCVGRMSEQKGQLLLLEALADAVQYGYMGNLVLVGDGPLRDQLEQIARKLGVYHRVEFAGWCDSRGVRERLLNARALVLPSFAEGLPVVIMEAMALQRPVLSTHIAGIPELVREGMDGWLVAPGDRQELKSALLRLGSCPLDRMREMGANAAEQVLHQHATKTEGDKLFRLFQSCEASKSR